MTDNDLISRSALAAALEEDSALMAQRAKNADAGFLAVQAGITLAMAALDAAPTIDPERHARWVRDDTLKDLYFCSNCLIRDHRKPKHKYCPDCGAKMDTKVISEMETTTEDEKDG